VFRDSDHQHSSEKRTLAVRDTEARPHMQIASFTLDPGASISPSPTPYLPKHYVCVLAGERHRRGVHFCFENATPGICQAVERIFDLADPTFDVTQETGTRCYMPQVSFEISGFHEGFPEFAATVSVSIGSGPGKTDNLFALAGTHLASESRD
jgi:hypothetical protein